MNFKIIAMKFCVDIYKTRSDFPTPIHWKISEIGSKKFDFSKVWLKKIEAYTLRAQVPLTVKKKSKRFFVFFKKFRKFTKLFSEITQYRAI